MSKISELSDGGSLLPTDDLIVVRSGGNVRVKADTINVDQIRLGDNEKIQLGNAQDFQIYHDGSHNFIEGVNAGNIYIRNGLDDGDVIIQSDNGSGGLTNYIQADGSNGEVRLFHYGSEKLNTTATGIDVTGTATMDGLVVNTGSFGAVEAGSGRMYGSSSHGLVIQGSGTTNDFLFLGSDGTDSFRIANNGDISFYEDTGTTAKLFWDASAESLGIGTSSPSKPLEVADATNDGTGGVKITSYLPTLEMQDISGGGTSFIIQQDGADTLFKHGTAERMRIDASGNLMVGATTTAYNNSNSVAISVDQGYVLQNHVLGTSSGAKYTYFSYNAGEIGSITQNGTTGVSYNTSSDQRLKENIADADDSGSKVDAIQVRKFDWKVDGSHQDYGMVAQELQVVAPEAVSGDADSEDMMGVDYSKLVPMMLKEIQSLRARVAQLES